MMSRQARLKFICILLSVEKEISVRHHAKTMNSEEQNKVAEKMVADKKSIAAGYSAFAEGGKKQTSNVVAPKKNIPLVEAYDWIQPEDLLKSVQSTYLTHVIDPNSFYVSVRTDRKLENRFRKITELMAEYYGQIADTDLLKIDNYTPATPCAAFDPEKEQWLRGTIIGYPISQTDGSFRIRVQYADSGKEGAVGPEGIRYLKEEFGAVPMLAIHCSLQRARPPGNRELYPEDSISFMAENIGRHFGCYLDRLDDQQRYEVSLYRISSGGFETTVDEVSVLEWMKKNEKIDVEQWTDPPVEKFERMRVHIGPPPSIPVSLTGITSPQDFHIHLGEEKKSQTKERVIIISDFLYKMTDERNNVQMKEPIEPGTPCVAVSHDARVHCRAEFIGEATVQELLSHDVIDSRDDATRTMKLRAVDFGDIVFCPPEKVFCLKEDKVLREGLCQAIPCRLNGVSCIGSEWKPKVVKRFLDYVGYPIPRSTLSAIFCRYDERTGYYNVQLKMGKQQKAVGDFLWKQGIASYTGEGAEPWVVSEEEKFLSKVNAGDGSMCFTLPGLPQLVLPTEKGDLMDVYISDINTTDMLFHVQPKHLYDDILKVYYSMDRYMDENHNTQTLVNPRKDELCAAPWANPKSDETELEPDDLGLAFYRAVVMDRPDPQNITVRLVDYGTEFLVHKDWVKILDADLKEYHPMAVPVRLANVGAGQPETRQKLCEKAIRAADAEKLTIRMTRCLEDSFEVIMEGEDIHQVSFCINRVMLGKECVPLSADMVAEEDIPQKKKSRPWLKREEKE